jgi:hypothetical protein
VDSNTKVHVLIGFANPYFICDECKGRVPYWHNTERCGCNGEYFNSPCQHKADITSVCPTWNVVEGCCCTNKETHDKE